VSHAGGQAGRRREACLLRRSGVTSLEHSRLRRQCADISGAAASLGVALVAEFSREKPYGPRRDGGYRGKVAPVWPSCVLVRAKLYICVLHSFLKRQAISALTWQFWRLLKQQFRQVLSYYVTQTAKVLKTCQSILCTEWTLSRGCASSKEICYRVVRRKTCRSTSRVPWVLTLL